MSISKEIALPKQLVPTLHTFSQEEREKIIAGWQVKRFQSFRINTLRSSAEEVESILRNLDIPWHKIPESEAYFFDEAFLYSFRGSKLFREGLTYLQSASSQIPVDYLDIEKHLRVLDACAAPGGKTTQMSALMENTGEIVAFESNQIRFDTLKHNISLQGATHVTPQKSGLIRGMRDYYDGAFDRILLDVPCSALGRVKLDSEKTYGFFSQEVVEKNRALQESLITACVPKLKEGGILVYATCTLTPQENQGMVEYIIENFPELEFVARKTLFPDEHFEGFFVAKFRKNSKYFR